MVVIGIVEICFPKAISKWDELVGRGPSSEAVHKVLGGISLVSGLFIIVLFNYLGPLKH